MRGSHHLEACVLAAVAATAACGGKEIDVGYDDARADLVDPSQPVDMNAVRRRCEAPFGEAEESATNPSTPALLAGRWFLCETNGNAGMDVPGVLELTAEGAWFALVPDAAGAYERDQRRSGAYVTGKALSCCYPDTRQVSFGATDPLLRRPPPLDATFYVEFLRNPRQMTWAPKSTGGAAPRPVVARFVKG